MFHFTGEYTETLHICKQYLPGPFSPPFRKGLGMRLEVMYAPGNNTVHTISQIIYTHLQRRHLAFHLYTYVTVKVTDDVSIQKVRQDKTCFLQQIKLNLYGSTSYSSCSS